MAARMRSRSFARELAQGLRGGGSDHPSHAGSSGVSARLRAQLGYADCLAPLAPGPHDGEPFGHPQNQVFQRHERRAL